MRIIHTDIIKREAKRLIYDCSFFVPPEIKEIYSMMLTEEDAPLARQSLSIISGEWRNCLKGRNTFMSGLWICYFFS
jgi:tartrate dehydratase alpha subunit/fumarate hydratase class I-like protein